MRPCEMCRSRESCAAAGSCNRAIDVVAEQQQQQQQPKHWSRCTCKECVEACVEPAEKPALPTDAKARKNAPVVRGVLDYFPLAILAVAELSRVGNEQHNPGEPMHWAREKSTDHADCAVRHIMERGTIDTDGQRHTAKAAWRMLAELQTELELAAEKKS